MPAPNAGLAKPAAVGLLVGRLLLALIFVHEGWTIVGKFGDAAAYMQKFGVSGRLLPAVIALELCGGFKKMKELRGLEGLVDRL